MFGKKTKVEKIKEKVQETPLVSGAALAAAAGSARPFAERLLYDEELRGNIRDFLEAARKIYQEISGEHPSKVASRLWDDGKLRSRIEEAAEAAQEGAKRIKGEKVGGGMGFFTKFLLVLAAAIGILLFNPKTGPEARQIAKNFLYFIRFGS